MLFVIVYLGLAAGSFIDALVWRIHKQEELKKLGHEEVQSRRGAKAKKKPLNLSDLSILRGRSMCENCHTTLKFIDLVPLVSWLSTNGKCRYCGHKIGIQSPLMEVFMGLLFTVIFIFTWPEGEGGLEKYIDLAFWLVSAVGLVAIAVYDLKWMIIPNRIILPLIGAAVAYVLIKALVFSEGAEAVKEGVLGLLVGGGLFYLLFVVSNGRWIGGGDVKLGFFLGIALGPLLSAVALWLSFVGALVVVLPLMIAKKITRKQPVPFGPFIILGVLAAVIWGQQLADWYNSTFLLGIY